MIIILYQKSFLAPNLFILHNGNNTHIANEKRQKRFLNYLQLIKKSFSPYKSLTFAFAILGLNLKIIIQSAVVIPAVAQISYTIHNFIIGFIHLLMLGCLSLFAFGIVS